MFYLSGSSVFKVRGGRKDDDFWEEFSEVEKVSPWVALLEILTIFGLPVGSERAPFWLKNGVFLLGLKF